MFSCALTGGLIDSSHELHVAKEILDHMSVLAAHRTINNGRTRSIGYGSRCSDGNCTIDNRQRGAKEFDIAGRLPNKVLDAERNADVQNVYRRDPHGGRRNIYSDRTVTFGSELKEGLTHFSKSDDNDLLGLVHERRSYCAGPLITRAGSGLRLVTDLRCFHTVRRRR